MAEENNAPDARAEEIAALKDQMEEIRHRLEELSAEPSAHREEETPEVTASQDSVGSAAPASGPSYQVPYNQPAQQVAEEQGSANFYSASGPYAYNYYAQNPYASNAYGAAPVVRAKDHVAAGLLGVFLGTFGIHKFYLGYNASGFIMLGITILGGLFTFGLATSIMWLIGLIEGIIYLTKSQQDFESVYLRGKKNWF